MRLLLIGLILLVILYAAAQEPELDVICVNDKGEIIFDGSEDEFMDIDSGSMPSNFECFIEDITLMKGNQK